MGLNQKRIVIVFNNLNIGGIERKIVDICNFYSNKKNFSVFLLLKSKKGKLLEEISKNIIIFGSNGNPLLFPFWLSRELNKIRPSLVISFGNYSGICSIFAKLIAFCKPKIIISDDSGLEKQIEKETFSKIRRLLIKITYPIADEIILLTESAKIDLIKLIPKTKNRIVVRENWLPLIFKKSKSEQKRDIDILFLARFEPQKNPIKFLEIVKKIKNKKDDIKVLMVGYGSLKGEIEHFVKSNDLFKNVLIKDSTIKPSDYYQRSKVLVLTSDYEGFPLTILESFSGGCVPVSNKIPEINDFFKKYYDDLLFETVEEAEKKILELISNLAKRKIINGYYQDKIFSEQKINFKETINEFQKYY